MRLYQEPSMNVYKAMTGYIHSIESFGTVDGPGVRYVVFMQGCPMRCLYCHNPDTWKIKSGTQMTVDEIMAGYRRNKAFYKKGGLTVTGGEPLLQIEFLTELFKTAKQEGIHTCIDTSGITYNEKSIDDFDELMKYTDLVMLDIKHINTDKHKKLTGCDNGAVLEFARYLEAKNIPLWIRHVVVEGLTDKKEDLVALGEFIGSLKNLKALDVIPYHTMGEAKYKELGLDYPLKGVPAMTHEKAYEAKKQIIGGINNI